MFVAKFLHVLLAYCQKLEFFYTNIGEIGQLLNWSLNKGCWLCNSTKCLGSLYWCTKLYWSLYHPSGGGLVYFFLSLLPFFAQRTWNFGLFWLFCCEFTNVWCNVTEPSWDNVKNHYFWHDMATLIIGANVFSLLDILDSVRIRA